jgi:hypothetical protein
MGTGQDYRESPELRALSEASAVKGSEDFDYVKGQTHGNENVTDGQQHSTVTFHFPAPRFLVVSFDLLLQ